MTEVTNDATRSCYRLEVEGGTAVAAYRTEGDRLVFTHTEVPEALEGQGIGSRLIAGALEDVRRRGLKIVPQCAFVAAYVDRHDEVRDLIAEPG